MPRAALLRLAMVLVLSAAIPVFGPGARARDDVGSITLTFYNCPEDMNRDTLVADQCFLTTEGFDVRISFDIDQRSIALVDAEFDGASFTWADLPAAPSHESGEGDPYYYQIEETRLPDGYHDYVVGGIDGWGTDDGLETHFRTRLVFDDPNRGFPVFNFVEPPPPVEPATVTITATICPYGFPGGDYISRCSDFPVSGARFTAARVGEERLFSHVFDSGQADDSGVVTLTAVRSALRGAIYVSESLYAYTRYGHDVWMESIDDVAVACGTADGARVDVSIVRFTRGSYASIEIPVQPGAAITCYWYNLNSDGGMWPGQPFDYTPFAVACDADTGDVDAITGHSLPAGCAALEGAGLTAATESGERVDSCVTDETGQCTMTLPSDEHIVFTEDEYSIPTGYAPLVNPITRHVSTELGVPVFINVPVDSTHAPFDLPIYVLVCDRDPGDVSSVSGRFPPRRCSFAEDVEVTAKTADGTDLGTCVTGADGVCLVATTSGSRVTVTENVDSIPGGYAPRENSITVLVYTEFTEVVFVNLPGAAETPTPAVLRRPSVLPTTSRPAHIHRGNCDELEYASSTNTISLTDLTAKAGRVEGAPDAVRAESSYTVIDVSIDELLATPRAINVHGGLYDPRTYLVCGEIGGGRDATGGLAIGLREVNDSGYQGIAYFAPDPADPNKTDVWVFIAPELAEEEQPAPVPTPALPIATPSGE